MRNHWLHFILISNFLLFVCFTQGQISEGGIPLSFTKKVNDVYQEVMIAAPALNQMGSRDKNTDKLALPYQFAVVVPVDISLSNSGTWTITTDGYKLWRVKIRTENAIGISLYFRDFYLPKGTSLFIYGKSKNHVLGAFTNKNNRKSGLFSTELVAGDEITMELNQTMNIRETPHFTIAEMDYAYRSVFIEDDADLYASSGECEVDIRCSPEGDLWQDIKKGIVRIKVKVGSGAYWCSGSLVNNTLFDLIPYIVTADHCAFKTNYATPEELEQWIFYFNYEAQSCNSLQVSGNNFSMTGAVKVASGGNNGLSGSDFYLVRLMDDIPSQQIGNVFFNGWSWSSNSSDKGVCIHHPGGDVKKVSTYTSELVSTSWQNNGLDSHWRVVWSETENGWGVTEGGSSGSPIFDMNGHIKGTLTGGLASCNTPDQPDYYGKFSYHWESNGSEDTLQLKPWLDPANTGLVSLNGQFYNDTNSIPNLAGNLIIKSEITEDVLSIKYPGISNPESHIIINNYEGMLIRNEAIFMDESSFTDIDISDLASGFYVISVTIDGNKFIRKFVKE